MPLSAAEKQARYRQKHLKDGTRERLQLVIDLHAKRALERLAHHNGLTQSAMLEKLVIDEQTRVTSGLRGDEFAAYVGE